MTKVTPEIEERIRRLYVPGVFGHKRVADETGVSRNTVRRIVNPEFAECQRINSRAAKRRRTGVCVDCGGVTRYGGKGGKYPAISQRCAACGRKFVGEVMKARRGTGGRLVEGIRAYLEGGPRRMTEIQKHLDTTKGATQITLHRLVKYGLIVRVSRGVYALPSGGSPTLSEPTTTTESPSCRRSSEDSQSDREKVSSHVPSQQSSSERSS